MAEDQLDRFAADLAAAFHDINKPIALGVRDRVAERLMLAGYRRVDAGESCGCGSAVWTDDADVVIEWRANHRCTFVPPGPCYHDSGVDVAVIRDIGEPPGPPTYTWRCELLAGHAGAHQADRGRLGVGVWPNEDEGG